MNRAKMVAKMFWKGEALQKAVMAAAVKGLREGAEYLLDEANKTIPHAEGMMQDSGKADVDENAMEAAVSYDTPYTVKQHENTRLRHPNGRRAKWLKLTLEEKHKQILSRIYGNIGNAMKGRK